jgi:hypothetical protein
MYGRVTSTAIPAIAIVEKRSEESRDKQKSKCHMTDKGRYSPQFVK